MNRLIKLALVLSAFALPLRQLAATTLYWDQGGSTGAGTSSSGTWNTTNTNWSTSAIAGVTPQVWATGDAVVFSALTGNAANDPLGSQTITLSGSFAVAGITFNSNPSNNASFGIVDSSTGHQLSIGAGGITVASNVAGNTAVLTADPSADDVNLSANQSWLNYGTGVLSVGAAGFLNGNTLTLGSPTATGAITIGNAGGNDDFANNNGGAIVIDGAAVDVSTSSGAFSNETLTLTQGSISTVANAKSLRPKNILINGNFGFASAGAVSIGSTTSATPITIQNSPTLTFAANTTAFLDNTITLDSNVTFVGAGAVTMSDSIGDAGVGYGLTLDGPGTVTVGGTTSTYTGNTVVDGGNLTLKFSTAGSPATNILNSASGLVVGGGIVETVGASASSSNSQTFSSLTVASGASIYQNGSSTSGTLSATFGTITRKVGGTLNFNMVNTNGAVYASNSNDAYGLLGAGITYAGNDWAMVTGGGAIAACTNYTTANAVSSWTANANITNSAAYTGALTSNLAIGSLRFNHNATGGPNLGTSTLTVEDGILVATTANTNALTISGGNIQGSTGGDLVVISNAAAGTSLTISSNIIDNTSATAFTASAGNINMTLSGNNSYTGSTFVNSGTLSAGVATNAFGNNSAIVISTGATLNISGAGFNETVGSLNSNNATSTGAINLGANTLTISGNNLTGATYGGGIVGTGAVIKNGAGIQTLSGTSTYSGGTTVGGGTLIVTGSISGSTSASVTSGGVLEVDGSFNNAVAPTVANGGLQGSGSIGGASLTSGTLSPGYNSTLGTQATGSLVSSASITLDSNSLFVIRLGLAASGSDCDSLALTGGTATLGGATLQLQLGSNFANAQIGTVYDIITGGNSSDISGQFGTVNSGAAVFDVLYNENATGTGAGDDVVLQLVSVPEPGAWPAILSGCGLLVGIQRLRKRRLAN